MSNDNLDGCKLSVMECRELLRYFESGQSPWSMKLVRKLEAGAEKETQSETNDRLSETVGSITVEEINDPDRDT